MNGFLWNLQELLDLLDLQELKNKFPNFQIFKWNIIKTPHNMLYIFNYSYA